MSSTQETEARDTRIPSRPPPSSSARASAGDPVVRSSLIAGLAAAGTYVFAPHLLGASTAGSTDEVAALLSGLAALVLANLGNAKNLCSEAREKKATEPLEIAKGGGAGFLGGVGIAGLTPQLLLFFVDGGILLGATLVGALFAKALIDRQKTKFCPTCGKKGFCDQKVCRHCHRIFWPHEDDPKCSRELTLTWYQVASFLDRRAGLTYLDSEYLLSSHLSKWKLFNTPDGLRIECESFMNWYHSASQEVLAAIGKGPAGRKEDEIDAYLRKKGL